MSHTAFIVRSLVLGAVLALGLAVVRRRRVAPFQALPSGAKRPGAGVASAPRRALAPSPLPLAFWDAEAELDAEDREPSVGPALPFDESYEAGALEDAGEWLSRATEARERDDADDPAEIAPDSWSIVSEASRAAAAGEPALDPDAPSQRG